MKRAVRPARFAPVAVVALALVLAGCASASPPPTASPTHTTALAVVPAASPGSRVPVKCADLYTTADVAPLVGAPVKVLWSESFPPASLGDLADDQSGVLGCDWGGNDAVEFGPLASLAIFIAPDSKSDFEGNFEKNMSTRPKTASPPVGTTGGDKSGYWCEASGRADRSPLCNAQMLVGDYWVTVQLSAIEPATESATSATTAKVLRAVATKLREAGPPRNSAWVAPAATPPDLCTGSGTTGQLQSILAIPGLTRSPPTKRTIDAASVALDTRDETCAWTDPTQGSVSFELLAGGSWAFPGFAPVAAGDDVVQSYLPVTVAGASSALLGVGEGQAEAYLAVGTTAAFVSMPDSGAAHDLTVLAAFAKLIADHQAEK